MTKLIWNGPGWYVEVDDVLHLYTDDRENVPDGGVWFDGTQKKPHAGTENFYEIVHVKHRLSSREKRAYVKHGFGHCPFCGHWDIEGGPVEIDGNLAWQDVTCSLCNHEWCDYYTLTAIEEDR